MDEKMLLDAVEALNGEVISLKNSKDYNFGRKLNKLIDCFKTHNIKSLWELVRLTRVRRSANRSLASEVPYERGDIILDESIATVRVSSKTYYSCITGDYDIIRNPIVIDEKGDYNLFSDEQIDTFAWKMISVSDICDSVAFLNPNRYCKTHPFELFPNNDFSLYIDGNVWLVSNVDDFFAAALQSDTGIAMHRHPSRRCIYQEAEECIRQGRGNAEKIRNQIAAYRRCGMPANYGLLEATVIAADLHNPVAKEILEMWWNEFMSWGSGRDQLSLPYVLWTMGLSVDDVGNLGTNVKLNPKLRVNPRHGRG